MAYPMHSHTELASTAAPSAALSSLCMSAATRQVSDEKQKPDHISPSSWFLSRCSACKRVIFMRASVSGPLSALPSTLTATTEPSWHTMPCQGSAPQGLLASFQDDRTPSGSDRPALNSSRYL